MKCSKQLMHCFLALAAFFVPNYAAIADLPAGKWHLTGNIEDVRMSDGEGRRTNDYSFEGHYEGGRFLIDMTPQDAEDDIAESAGREADLVYLIQRYPKSGHKNGPRTESLAAIEPTVFSRYATHALVSVLMAFANTNDLARLSSGKDVFILGNLRRYPEENNTFNVTNSSDRIEIEATCYGGDERTTEGMVPIQGFESGFKRWSYQSALNMSSATDGVILVHYERFYPSQGRLYLERRVSGSVNLKSESTAMSSFTPKISENELQVHDYRYRAVLFPLSKGIADQYHFYVLQNHSWDADTNQIAAHFAQLKEYLSRPSTGSNSDFQARLKDDPIGAIYKNRIIHSHRNIILVAFVVFSAGFLGVILYYSWRERRKHEKSN